MNPTTAERELLPCPFCGSEAIFGRNEEADDEGVPGQHYGGEWIECSSCGACTNTMFLLTDDPKDELAERWNRRAGWQARAGYGEQSADDTFEARPVAQPVAQPDTQAMICADYTTEQLALGVKTLQTLREKLGKFASDDTLCGCIYDAMIYPHRKALGWTNSPVDREGRLDTGDAK